jgi:hypothetical protein
MISINFLGLGYFMHEPYFVHCCKFRTLYETRVFRTQRLDHTIAFSFLTTPVALPRI